MVVSLLTPLKIAYGAAKKRAEPYRQIVEEVPEDAARHRGSDEKSVGEIKRAYILVNNHSDGNTSMTSQALVYVPSPGYLSVVYFHLGLTRQDRFGRLCVRVVCSPSSAFRSRWSRDLDVCGLSPACYYLLTLGVWRNRVSPERHTTRTETSPTSEFPFAP